MEATEHIKVTRLMDAAVTGLILDGAELSHQSNCDACQDLFEIFRTKFPCADHADHQSAGGRKVVA
jgi:hypothetical protein